LSAQERILQMRKIALFAVAAGLSLVAIGGWVIASTQARLDTPKDVRIDPSQIMAHVDALPVRHVVDFSVVFE
jgi:hypothetical protein